MLVLTLSVETKFRNLDNNLNGPNDFEMKLISIDLVEEYDEISGNITGTDQQSSRLIFAGVPQKIYVHPQCDFSDDCGPQNTTYIVTNFTQFSLPTDQLQKSMSSQQFFGINSHPIFSLTYSHAGHIPLHSNLSMQQLNYASQH